MRSCWQETASANACSNSAEASPKSEADWSAATVSCTRECLEFVAELRQRADEVVLILGRSRVGGRALEGFVALLETRGRVVERLLDLVAVLDLGRAEFLELDDELRRRRLRLVELLPEGLGR